MKSRDEDFYFKYRTEEMAKLTSGMLEFICLKLFDFFFSICFKCFILIGGILNEIRSNINSAKKGNSTLQLALFSAVKY